MKYSDLFAAAALAGMVSLPVHAEGNVSTNSSNACPVGLVSGLNLDDEFGPGTQALSHCLDKRNEVEEYTTTGLTSLADFQARGYQYIQP